MDGPPGGRNGSQQMPPPTGPPYLPMVAVPGGRATTDVDVPVCATLIALFALAGATHLIIYRRNLSRGHKFVFSVLLFAFCIARVAALSVRIASAHYPTDANVGIAASVLLAAGVIILFIVNLILAQRLVRAYHPAFGWSKGPTLAFRLVFVGVAAMLVMVVTATVHSFMTADSAARANDRIVQLVASTALAVLALAPAVLAVAAAAWPCSHPAERFGAGSPRTQLVLLAGTSLILAFGAGFRTGVAFDPRPAAQPAWFHGKGPYYAFNYGIELIVVVVYAVMRFDRRFHVPDGSSAPGDYSRPSLRSGPSITDGEKDGTATLAQAGSAGRSGGDGGGSSHRGQTELADSQQKPEGAEGLFEPQAETTTTSGTKTRGASGRDREKEVRGSFIDALTGPNFPPTPPSEIESGESAAAEVAEAAAATAAMDCGEGPTATIAATAAAADADATKAGQGNSGSPEHDGPVIAVAAASAAGNADDDERGYLPSPFLGPTACAGSFLPPDFFPRTPSSRGYATPPESESETAADTTRRFSCPSGQWEERARNELEKRLSIVDPKRHSMT